jgi:ubiquinol-cytochrome c reductase cytochrome b subunit
VIVNLFAAVPFIGPDLALLIRGDYVVGDATLNRFFAFHVIAVPLVLLGLVAAHIIALHEVGSNNPDGVEIKARLGSDGRPLDGIPFHPYYTVHDIFAVSVFLVIFCAIVFFAPEFGGYFLEYNNFIPADPLKTPAHIAPVWYFTPYYSMLRATTDQMMAVLSIIVAGAAVLAVMKAGLTRTSSLAIAIGALVIVTLFGGFKSLFTLLGMSAFAKVELLAGFEAKFWGVVVMGGSVLILFFLPWLDRSPVKSIRYRPDWHKWLYVVFILFFLVLGYLGSQPPSEAGNYVSQVGTLVYFGFFLLMPWWSRLGQFKPVPERVNYTAH